MSAQIAKLPVFGRICSLAARALGMDPLAFAGPKQKLWHREAQSVLAKISELGGSVENFAFLARDERKAWSFFEKALSIQSIDPDEAAIAHSEKTASLLSHRASNALGMTPVHARHSAASFEGGESATHVSAMAAALGSARAARACIIAHEWAHAWQNSQGHVFAAATAISAKSELSPLALDELRERKLAGREDGSRGHGAHSQAILRTEEVFCDALACWVLDRMGMPGMAPKLAAFRFAHARMGGSQSHQTHRGLLDFFHPDSPMPEHFKGFVDLALTRGAQSSSHCFEPRKAPKA